MALQGYIVGISTQTGETPHAFWAGVGASQTDQIDDAHFIPTIAAARTAAGKLQLQMVENHVEAYAVTKTIDYAPLAKSDGNS